MPRSKSSPKALNTSAGGHVRTWPARLTQGAFVLALAVVFARGTMLESVRDALEIEFGADPVPRGPGPAASLVLDLLCCLPALLVLVRRLIDPAFALRFAWSHVAFFALALCAALSSLWAADKFIALVTGAHVIAAAALLWAVAQLVRSWLRLRLVGGLCFGLLLASLAHGMIYRYVDLPDMQRSWERDRETILKQRGWEPGSFHERQFANKILGGEMIGFHVSPNAFAAIIVMLTVISLGVAVQRFAYRDEPAWGAAILLVGVVSVVMIYWTHSKTAMATLLLAVLALAALAVPRARALLANHSRKVYWTGLTVCVLGVIAVAGHGIYHGGLFEGRFGNSLHFRWRYWVAAERMFETNPLLGVGWSNFGSFYTAHRLPEAAEEVRDPHNFLVRAFVELGLIGGVLLIAWLARMGWELTRPVMPPLLKDANSAPAARPGDPGYSMSAAIMAMSAIAGLGFLINVFASVDFAESPDYAFVEVFKRVLYACLLFAGGLVVAVRSSKRQELDDRPAPWILYSALIALATLLVQNLVDISLFEAGPLMAFALLAGAAGGIRSSAGATEARATPPVAAATALALAALAWVAALLFVVAPVVSAQNEAHLADIDIRYGRMPQAEARLRTAFRAVPSNADYAFRAARAAIMDTRNPRPDDVRALLDAAVAADPSLIKGYLMRAEFELHQENPDAAAIQANYDKALTLNPADINVRLRYAAALEDLGLKKEAAEQYRIALDFNDKLPAEEPERLPPERVTEIEQKMIDLAS